MRKYIDIITESNLLNVHTVGSHQFEIFYNDGSDLAGTQDGEEGNGGKPGYYWTDVSNGLLSYGDWNGPFATPKDAYDDAIETLNAN